MLSKSSSQAVKRARSTTPNIEIKDKITSSLTATKTLHDFYSNGNTPKQINENIIRPTWEKRDSALVLDYITPSLTAGINTSANNNNKIKIAAFDMDDTLIMPASGKVFPTGRKDWKWLHNSVLGKLHKIHNDEHHHILIISNQAGIGKKGWNEKKADEIRGKVLDICEAAGLPISCWASTTEDNWRKPSTKIWDDVCSVVAQRAPGYTVDTSRSYYVGDAAGRKDFKTMAGRKKDFSCSDRKFAYNIAAIYSKDFKFYTPEEYFLGQSLVASFDWDGVGPEMIAALPTGGYKEELFIPDDYQTVTEMVIFTGLPGSGKTTVFNRFFGPKGYVHINGDLQKSKEKCHKVTTEALKEGQSVVVDNTNPGVESRSVYIAIAKKMGVKRIRAFHFKHSKDLANHMNIVRGLLGTAPRVSSIAYNVYGKAFEAPTVGEGFTEVIDLDPVVDFTDLPGEIIKHFYCLT
eukprot:Tbor_TRINITY_DN5006_c0_g1::TRINITY_DN5006_c0_g1_i1::g.14422::m.14422/K08073/PNKP; bifunctional polynucleotide phosphatase/kinase